MNRFRLLILFFMMTLTVSGSNNAIAAQIIDKTLTSLIHEEKIMAWGETSEHFQMIKESSKMEWTKDPKNAQFILISTKVPDNLPDRVIVFATEYKMLVKDERVIGAFFWQKGRPNLLFLRDRLQKSNLTLGKEFTKYIEDEL